MGLHRRLNTQIVPYGSQGNTHFILRPHNYAVRILQSSNKTETVLLLCDKWQSLALARLTVDA